MKSIQISAQKRTETGKKSTRDLRKADMVPCVMYGGAEVLHFYAHENDFRHIVYTPNVFIVELDIEGNKRKAVMQDLQFHPVSDKLNHIDFVEVFDDRPVTVELPIKLTGVAVGLKDGGKPRQRRRVVKVRGLIAHLPEVIEIDITDVAVGDVVKVGDIQAENLEILDPARSMVYAIVSSRLSMKGMEIEDPDAEVEGEEGAEAAEGGEAPAEETAAE